MKIKIDPAKALSITVTALGVVGTLLSAKVAKNDQAALKAELKDELMKELQNKQESPTRGSLIFVHMEGGKNNEQTKFI